MLSAYVKPIYSYDLEAITADLIETIHGGKASRGSHDFDAWNYQEIWIVLAESKYGRVRIQAADSVGFCDYLFAINFEDIVNPTEVMVDQIANDLLRTCRVVAMVGLGRTDAAAKIFRASGIRVGRDSWFRGG